ncbi:MAG: hypothetical protein QNJ31_04630 [Candidatus Caenarcaniphilales bacterium]|nr:hypothetical protein [Candidatus Caenarcaniphilales bacterium]
MREHQFDDLNKVIDYNSELWFRFLGSCEQGIQNAGLPEKTVTELSQSLDLIRAINSYRSYATPELLFRAYPELKAQEEYVNLLWKHFESLSSEELSNLVIEMIHEVCNSI